MGASTPESPLHLSLKVRIAAFVLFILTLVFHSVMSFDFFAPERSFAKYPAAAEMLLRGELPPERLLDFSPLYLAIHSAARQTFRSGEIAVLGLHVGLITLSGYLLFLILASHFSAVIAFCGWVAFTIIPSTIVYERVMEPEPLMVFLILAFAHQIQRPGRISKVIAGIIFSLLLITRANFAPLLLVLPVLFKFQEKQISDWLKTSLAFFLPVTICIFLVWFRNWKLLDTFSPYVMNPGYVFYEGNNPNSTGQSAIYPPLVDDAAWDFPGQPDIQHELYRLFARRITGEPLSIVRVNQFWTSKATAFIFDHPLHFLKLLLVKAHFFFHNYRRHDVATAHLHDRTLLSRGPPVLPFGIVSVLAVIGLFLALNHWKRYFLFYAIFLNQLAILVVTYVSDRQRMAVLPLFIFFACAALSRGFRSRKTAIITLGACAALGTLFFFQTDLMREEDHLWTTYEKSHHLWIEARQARNDGKIGDGSRLAAQSLILTPWLKDHRRPAGLPYPDGGFTRTALKLEPEEERADFSSRYNRAILHFEAGQYETARLLLLDLLSERHRFKRDFDHCSEPRYYLARIHRYQGDRNAALEALRSGLRKTPGNPFLLSLLYVTTGFEEHRHRLFRYFDRISGSFLLGQAFLDHDQPRKALPYFRYVVQTLPEYRRGWIYLASALARSGADNEAARSFIRAIKKRSDPVFFENEMVSVFQRWQQHDPGDISRRFLYGLVLRYFGRYHQALEIQKSLSERFPENVDVATEIGLLERVINGAGVQPQVR